MRRSLLIAAPVLLAWSAAASAETLDELLASRALETVAHPAPAEFLAAEGAGRLSEEQRARAVEQLRVALQRQTNPMLLTARGAGSMMSTPSMQRLLESMQRQSVVGGIVRSQLGIDQAVEQLDPAALEREMQEAMAEPWVRAIGAARAVAGLGDADAAARFYVSCLQMLETQWVPDACLEDILRLGPRRAVVLLEWMLENAGAASLDVSGLSAAGGRDDPGAPDRGTVQLRNAALEGLGALIGDGALSAESRERAFGALMRYGTGHSNEPYLPGAAEGLARSKDPRAVPLLEKLADRDELPDVQQTALRGLAVAFGSDRAIERLHRNLKAKDRDTQLRAAQALYETGDEQAFDWAVELITERRTSSSAEPDFRDQVVRDLVELGGRASAPTLQAALAEGSRNDWIEAWVSVGLLELGDASVAPRVASLLAIDDWEFDPRGVRSLWRAIKPWLQFTVSAAMSGGFSALSSSEQLRQVSSLVGNAVTDERGRYLKKLSQREALTARFRWQAADAIAAAQPEGSLQMLERLLNDTTSGVRSSAALALTRIDDPKRLGLIANAYEQARDDTLSGHGPELRATLVRSAALQAHTAETMALLARAKTDADPGVRFIALVASGDAR